MTEGLSWRLVLKGAAVAAIVGASLLAAARGHAAEPLDAPHQDIAPADPTPANGLGSIAHADVRVRVIHAKTGTKHFDAHLEDLRRYLEKFNYNSYHEVIDDTIHLQVAETKGIGLLSGKNLNATLVAVTPEKAMIRLVLNGQAGQMLDTVVSAGPDKLFFIAGPRYDDGILFLAIEPHYDPNHLPAPAVSDTGNRKHE